MISFSWIIGKYLSTKISNSLKSVNSHDLILEKSHQFHHPFFIYHHQPLLSCEDYSRFGPSISPSLNCCTPTKNLFLVDRKKNFFLITVSGDATIDFKTVSKAVGSKGRVKLANNIEIQKTLKTG